MHPMLKQPTQIAATNSPTSRRREEETAEDAALREGKKKVGGATVTKQDVRSTNPNSNHFSRDVVSSCCRDLQREHDMGITFGHMVIFAENYDQRENIGQKLMLKI